MQARLLPIASLLAATMASHGALAQSSEEVDLLRQQIEAQQRQLEAMQERLDELQRQTEAATDTAREAAEAAAPEAVIESGEERIKLSISGQVNRAVNIADDGRRTKVYNVDNDNSSTRFRFDGEGTVNEEFSIGALIELEVQSNPSNEVSQEDEDTGTATVNDRKAEVIFDHERFGALSLGQGSTASDGTSEVDLSGTDVIGYSSISDLAGGLLFVDSDEYTDVDIGDVFSNLDGLSRQDRIRYDTPEFAGFQLSGDVISNQRYSTALRWAGDFGDIEAAAAAAYSNPNDDGNDYIINGSASALHKPSGLNLTVAAGTQDEQSAKTGYIKAGYIAELVDIGSTNFSVDYGRDVNFNDSSSEGNTIGGFAVQNLADFGTEFFTGVRWHEGQADDNSFDDIWVLTFGSRVKF